MTIAVAKQISYKWYFAEKFTQYTKTKEDWNVSRKKENEYLKSINITGSNKGSDKNPKNGGKKVTKILY